MKRPYFILYHTPHDVFELIIVHVCRITSMFKLLSNRMGCVCVSASFHRQVEAKRRRNNDTQLNTELNI